MAIKQQVSTNFYIIPLEKFKRVQDSRQKPVSNNFLTNKFVTFEKNA